MTWLDVLALVLICGYVAYIIFRKKKTGCCGNCSQCSGCTHKK